MLNSGTSDGMHFGISWEAVGLSSKLQDWCKKGGCGETISLASVNDCLMCLYVLRHLGDFVRASLARYHLLHCIILGMY